MSRLNAGSAGHKRRRKNSLSARGLGIEDGAIEMQIFARNIRRRRMELSLSQDDIADLTGLPQSRLSTIEKGKSNFTIETAAKIAYALKTSVYLLFQA